MRRFPALRKSAARRGAVPVMFLAAALAAAPLAAQTAPAPANPASAAADQVKRLAAQAPAAPSASIVYFGQSSWLGVSLADLTNASAQRLGLASPNGALVKTVVPGSPAAQAGLEPGDVIVAFRGRSVVGVRQLRRLVQDTPVHRTVAVQVIRQHHPRTLEVTLGAFGPGWNHGMQAFAFHMPPIPPLPPIRVKIPPMPPMPPMPPPRMEFFFSPASQARRLGLSVATIPAQLAHYFGDAADSALLVQQVTPHSPAARAGFHAGDVILSIAGQPVHDRDGLGTALLDMSHAIPVTVLRARRQITLHLAPPPAGVQPTVLNAQWAAWAAAERQWGQKLAQAMRAHRGEWLQLEQNAQREQAAGQQLERQLQRQLQPQLRQLEKQLQQLQKQHWDWQTTAATASS